MSHIFIYDQDEVLQLILNNNNANGGNREASATGYTQLAGMYIGLEDEDAPKENPANMRSVPFQNGWFTEQLNGQEKLEFEVLADNPAVKLIERDGRAVIRNSDGEFVEFIIRVIEDRDGMGGTFKNVQAEGGEYELIDEWVTQYKASNVTLRVALGAILQGTRWRVGDIDDFGTQSIDLRNMSVKAAIYELLNIFGGERKSRVEVTGNRITRRYLDVLKNRGVDTGKRFVDGKDIISTSRVVDSSGIKTALYGFGASRENDLPRINFADVEWSKANGDPVDKPLGQTWVGDPDALQRYGYDQGRRHRFGSYDGQEEDPAELLLNTWKELQTLNHVNETYEIGVILLEELTGYAHEKVRLGDRAYAINKRIYPEVIVENSIIEYRQNLNDRKLSEVKLGNFRRAYDLSGMFNRVERTVDERQGNWDKKETPQGAQNKANTAEGNAISEAQRRINQARQDLESDISDAETAIQNAQSILDDVTEDVDGVTRLKGILAVDEIIADNTTLTGTLIAPDATILDLTVKDATIENATITGELLGVGGTFTGDIETSRLTVGASSPGQYGNVLALKMPFRVSEGVYDWANDFEITANNFEVEFSSASNFLTFVFGGDIITDGLNVSNNITLGGDIEVNGTIYGDLQGTATNASRLNNISASQYSRTNHNHDGRYTRVYGNKDIWLEATLNDNLNVFIDGSYVGTITV